MNENEIEHQIKQIEDELGVLFPETIKKLYRSHENKKYERKSFEIKGINDKSVISEFLSFDNKRTSATILGKLEYFSELKSLLLIPIASDVFGNLICLSFNPTDAGKLFFVDHEIDYTTIEDLAIYSIANSFEDFIENLEDLPKEEDNLDEMTRIIREGKIQELKELLLSGIDPNTKNESGRTLIEEALYARQYEIIKLLMSSGADYLSYMQKLTGLLNVELTEKIYSSMPDPNLNVCVINPIMQAFNLDNYDVMDTLLKLKVNIDKDDPEWKSIINESIRMDNLKGLEKLKEIGFDDHELQIRE